MVDPKQVNGVVVGSPSRCRSLGVQTTSFVALIGAAGLAIGLALQGSLPNVAAGVLIALFRHFRMGDSIEAASTKGTAQEI